MKGGMPLTAGNISTRSIWSLPRTFWRSTIREEKMLRINFTTHILGPLATLRLRHEKVTQTLRARDSLITEAILSGEVKVGDQIRIALNNRILGIAKLSIFDRVSWAELDIDDAHRGGFDSLPELGLALKRAGYRFKSLDGYTFYRIQFQWLEKVSV